MYQTPGVYIKDLPLRNRSVTAASTSIPAFLGHVKRGQRVTDKDGEPVLIRSVSQYGQLFGPLVGDPGGISNEGAAVDAFGHAINAFFANGGSQAYVVPVAKTAGNVSTCTVVIKETVANADDLKHTITFDATSPGKWADTLLVRLRQEATGAFTLTIGTQDATSQAQTDAARKQHDTMLETFTGLSLAASNGVSIKHKVNGVSSLVTITVDQTITAVASDPNDAQAEMTGGTDTSAPGPADYAQALERLKDYRDIATILLPGKDWTHDKTVYESAITHAEVMKNRMVIVDPQNPQTSAKQLNTRRDITAAGFPVSPYAVLYYPHLTVTNPYYHAQAAPTLPETFEIGPSAVAAGVWARTDSARGVWKAPAGTEATVRGTLGPTLLITNAIQSTLNPSGVNCLRPLRGPTVIWGARTLSSNTEDRYISVRRTKHMIYESLYRFLQGFVFEPNDQTLWSSLRVSVTNFMNGLYRAGALQGATNTEAYFVRCGLGSTMTQADVDAGIVKVEVGFAPLKPAEFIVLKMHQTVGQTR